MNEIDTEKLKQDYKLIRDMVIDDIRESGNKKSTYTDELLEFLFICIYKLIAGLGMSQKEAGEIFGLRANDFSKLGIFPDRCFNSFSKEADCFLPIEKEQDNIRDICDFLNKKVLTNYACRGVIAVTNTPSIFVNVAAGDNKKFAMTIPEPVADEDGIWTNGREFNYGFARYLFYDGNRLEDKDGNKITFGQVKNKISELINLTHINISVPLVEHLLQSDMDMSQLVKDGQMDMFNQRRLILQDTYEKISTYQARLEAIETGYIGTEDYFENGYDVEEYQRRADEGRVGENGRALVKEDYEVYSNRILREAVNKKNILLCDLMQNISINKIVTEDNLDVLKFVIKSITDQMSTRVLINDMSEENILVAAASYFVSEYFKNNGVCLSAYEELKEYLKTKKISDFIDAIGNSGITPLDMNDSLLDWLIGIDGNTKVKGKLGMKILRKSIEANKEMRTDEPVLLYIDTDAYPITQEEVTEVFNMCLIIVRMRLSEH